MKPELTLPSTKLPHKLLSPTNTLTLLFSSLPEHLNFVMADNGEGEGSITRGNEWEVVSLTASAYSAAPGLKEVDVKGYDEGYNEGEGGETSHALFMSGHFVFPPNQHENLPLEPEAAEIQSDDAKKGDGGKDVVSEYSVDEGSRSSGKDEENWTLKDLTVPDEFPGMEFFDKTTTLQGLDLIDVDKEQCIYSTSKFSSFHNETAIGGSAMFLENTSNPEVVEPSDRDLDLTAEISSPSKIAEKDEVDGSDLPCKAWWKRRATSVYAHAKDANAFWSVFVAAAVMGLVIIGQHWQQERWQTLLQKWQFSINDEKKGRMLGPIARLKDVLVGGNVRGSLVGARSSAEN